MKSKSQQAVQSRNKAAFYCLKKFGRLFKVKNSQFCLIFSHDGWLPFPWLVLKPLDLLSHWVNVKLIATTPLVVLVICGLSFLDTFRL